MDADALSDSSLTLLIFNSTVAGVVTSFIGWTTLFWLLCAYSPHHTSEWHCRWVTVLHAIIVVILSAWSVFVQGPWPFTDPGNVSLFANVNQQAVMGKFQISSCRSFCIAWHLCHHIITNKYSSYSQHNCHMCHSFVGAICVEKFILLNFI